MMIQSPILPRKMVWQKMIGMFIKPIREIISESRIRMRDIGLPGFIYFKP